MPKTTFFYPLPKMRLAKLLIQWPGWLVHGVLREKQRIGRRAFQASAQRHWLAGAWDLQQNLAMSWPKASNTLGQCHCAIDL